LNERCEEYGFSYFSVVPQWKINDEEELNLLVIDYIYKKDYEGLVIKNREAIWREGQSINWIKIKKKEREINTKNKNGEKVNFKFKYGCWV